MSRHSVVLAGRTIQVTDHMRGGTLEIHWPIPSYIGSDALNDSDLDPLIEYANELIEGLANNKFGLVLLGTNRITMDVNQVPVYMRLSGHVVLAECDLVSPVLHNVDLANVRSTDRLVAYYSRLTDIKLTSGRFDYCHMGSQKFTKEVQYNHNSPVDEVQL